MPRCSRTAPYPVLPRRGADTAFTEVSVAVPSKAWPSDPDRQQRDRRRALERALNLARKMIGQLAMKAEIRGMQIMESVADACWATIANTAGSLLRAARVDGPSPYLELLFARETKIA